MKTIIAYSSTENTGHFSGFYRPADTSIKGYLLSGLGKMYLVGFTPQSHV
jgi:hypothetical protein